MIASRLITRAAPRAKVVTQQRRGFLDYITNYPDKINEIKKIQMKGGTCQGEANPTWLKQEGDNITNYVGMFLCFVGFAQLASGHYKLATGSGKMPE
ncbi:expressed unknown protein [Seminavis robusta]|uniref:Uncharacterized protein n=1 Tax=Seminavis robusta TaxID=568900 RepID=A0A9N8EIF3_9STRA|nr:expressed unknown protein [Seminavis robusta]|eukprot:Sro1221_g253610.1 n/a (97) ;mRNA; f:1704-2192